MAAKTFALVKQFYSRRKVAKELASHLKEGARIAFSFSGEEGDYYFTVTKSGPGFVEGKAPNPDISLTIPPAAARKLFSIETNSVAELGIAFFKAVVQEDPKKKIVVRIHSSLITLTRKGYLRILLKGGPQFLRWAATRGLGSLSAIKAAIGKLRPKRK